MKLYSDIASHRTRQVLADLLALAYVWVVVSVSREVGSSLDSVAGQARASAASSRDVAGNLGDASAVLGRTPLVGDQARAPFDSAREATLRIAGAGESGARQLEGVAHLLGACVLVLGLALLLAAYVRPRLTAAVAAARAEKDSQEGDLDLWALRALTRRSHRELRAVPDAADGWRRGDPRTIRRLADLELRRLGVGAAGAQRED